MLQCVHCRHSIRRSSAAAAVGGTSHGCCARCFVLEHSSVPIGALTANLAEDDELPVGRIVLDANLRVVHYSAQESAMSGLSAERVLGRHFFDDIAPCLHSREVSQWCAARVSGDAVETTELDWLMEFPRGRRVAILTIAAGCGRVLLEIEPHELEWTEELA